MDLKNNYNINWSQKTMNDFFAKARIGILIVSVSGNCLKANEFFCDLIGTKEDDFQGTYGTISKYRICF